MVKLVPYNNGMRLGQGFNSYLQQICIDDAVIVDPTRAENVLTNDGTTMRILAQKTNKASVWRQMKEYVIDGKETTISTEPKNLIEKVPEEEKENQQETIQYKDLPEVELKSVLKHDNKETEIQNQVAEQMKTETTSENTGISQAATAAPKSAEGIATEGKGDGELGLPSDADLASKEPKTKEQIEAEKAKEAETRKKIEEENKRFQKENELKEKDIGLETWKSPDENIKERHTEMDKRTKESHVSDGIGKDLLIPEKWTIEDAKGTSQTVTYSSYFVDKVSEINNDMRLSAALSIKAGKFGGSGRGSFFSSEEFNESDLRFYISVKVTNQSINFKDALQYNPVPNIKPKDGKEFAKVFGDSFISGFVEGGEFNALVLMKIKNEAKLQDIKAEVKVAFTTSDKDKDEKPKEGDKKVEDNKEEPKKVEDGKKADDKAVDDKKKDKKGVQINAEGNLKLAKRNIAMNAETTIYVSWCGGAAIKPYDEPWTIDSLMAAAQRFPALVALYPQRIYAQLTEYNHLRSFVKLKPKTLLPITYKNASMYTNTLLDYYMEYKTLFQKISKDILDIQNGTKVFKEELKVDDGEKPKDGAPPEEASDPSMVLRKVQLSQSLLQAGLNSVFPSSLEGLGLARQLIRKQMNEIVIEVDEITENPEKVLEMKVPKWAGPASFSSIIPKIEFKVRKVRGTPLTNKSLTESKQESSTTGLTSAEDAFVVHLFDSTNSILQLSEIEQLELSEIEEISPSLADKTRVTAPVGSTTAGNSFTSLEHNLPEPIISQVTVWQKDGIFCCMSVMYDIGLTVEYGGNIDDHMAKDIEKKSKFIEFKLKNLGLSEMITSASVEVEGGRSLGFINNSHEGHDHSNPEKLTEEVEEMNKLRVIGIALSTNRGQKLQALCQLSEDRRNEFTDKHKIHQFEKPLKDTYISGFWGRQSQGGIHRLGFIWTQAPPREDLFDDDFAIECVGGSLDKSEKVTFERTLPDIPNLIYGVRSFGMLVTPNETEKNIKITPEYKNLCIRSDLSKITNEGFTYSHFAKEMPKIVDWMILPELKDTFIQSGTIEFNHPIENKECQGSYDMDQTIEFPIPFSDEKNIHTICWLMDFETDRPDAEKENNAAAFYIKTAVIEKKTTTKTMVIKVGDGEAFVEKKDTTETTTAENVNKPTREFCYRFWRAKIGWLAYERSDSLGSAKEFAVGKIESELKPDQNKLVWETTWENKSGFTFPTEPNQTFIAISEIRGNVRDYAEYLKNPTIHYSVSLKKTTNNQISLIAEGPQKCRIGAVWVSSL